MENMHSPPKYVEALTVRDCHHHFVLAAFPVCLPRVSIMIWRSDGEQKEAISVDIALNSRRRDDGHVRSHSPPASPVFRLPRPSCSACRPPLSLAWHRTPACEMSYQSSQNSTRHSRRGGPSATASFPLRDELERGRTAGERFQRGLAMVQACRHRTYHAASEMQAVL
jgi:hypothetical protein